MFSEIPFIGIIQIYKICALNWSVVTVRSYDIRVMYKHLWNFAHKGNGTIVLFYQCLNHRIKQKYITVSASTFYDHKVLELLRSKICIPALLKCEFILDIIP